MSSSKPSGHWPHLNGVPDVALPQALDVLWHASSIVDLVLLQLRLHLEVAQFLG
jgi:hypothetical protein